MPESVVCLQLHELCGRLLFADKALYSRPHVVIYHFLWDMPEIMEAFDVCFHYGLLALTSEQPSPPAVAAECYGSHVELLQFTLDEDLHLAPVIFEALTRYIFLLDEAFPGCAV